MNNKTYELIVEVEKPLLIDDLETVIKEGEGLSFPINRSYEANLINSHWNKFIIDMAHRKREDIMDSITSNNLILYDDCIKHIAGISSMYRLNNAALSGKTLELVLGVTDFKDYIGTTQHALIDEQFRNRLIAAGMADHNDPNHYFANPLAVCANIVTSDGFIPVGMRGDTVAIYKNMPHVIGGYVKVNGNNKPDFSVKDVDLSDDMIKELGQELGLQRDDIEKIYFLGIVRNKAIRGPEIMYHVQLNINSDELMRRWAKQSRDKFEHRNITLHSKDELPIFLEKYKGKMVPSGEATLSLFIQHYT